MARMVVVYREAEDVEAFRRHYFETHAPLVEKLPGLRGYDVSRGPIAGPAGPSDAFLIATLHFDDMPSLRGALASEQGQACGADRRKFAPDASKFQMFFFESQDLLPSASKGAATPNFIRAEAHKSAEVPASAAEVWDLLTDWAGMLRWWLKAEQGGLSGPTLVKCDLIGQPAAVPRTRRMTLDNGIVVKEQIFQQDDEARRLYYSKTEPPGSPVRAISPPPMSTISRPIAAGCTLPPHSMCSPPPTRKPRSSGSRRSIRRCSEGFGITSRGRKCWTPPDMA